MTPKMLLIIILALVGVVIIPLGILAFSPSYNFCVGHNGALALPLAKGETNPIQQAFIDSQTPIHLFRYCAGIYVSENADAITATATVILTVATLLLGWLAFDQGKTSRAQLRAYVFIEEYAVDNLLEGGVPRFRLRAKNFGQTPAFEAVWTHIYDFF